MDTQLIIELIGYLGSALVVVSMLMTSVVRLRVINLIGSVIFTIYALIIRSYPTAAMNLFLVGINVYHLYRLLRTRRHYDLVRADGQDGYLRYLLEDCGEDIRRWFPDFAFDPEGTDLACIVCCDRNPAGIFLARDAGEGAAEVLLDYTTPVYRDTSVGRYLYGELAKAGWRTLTFGGNAPGHVNYMVKMGYRRDDRGAYVLSLPEA